MDVDKAYIHALLLAGEKGWMTSIDRGVDPEQHLFPAAKKAYLWIKEHRQKYSLMPSFEIAVALMDLQFEEPPTDPLPVLIEALFKRRVYTVVREGVEGVTKKLESLDPLGAAEGWAEIHQKLLTEKLTTAKIESLFMYAEEVIQLYDNAKAGKRGIPTPWPTMDDQTQGWWPEDLALFVARLGTGKTWTMMLTCHTAWKAGAKVLIATTEMRSSAMAQRFFALHFRLNYGELRRGRLGEFVEKEFKNKARDLAKEHGLYIVGGGFDFTMDSLEGAVDQSSPDIVAVDGAYLIKNKGKDRNERVANNFDDLKRLAKRRKTCCIANTQFNRSAKSKDSETISAENIGMTDVAGFNSDVIYGLMQDDTMRDAGEMIMKGLKVREGRPGEIRCRWDLDRMDFSEIVDPNNIFQDTTVPTPAPEPMIGTFVDDTADPELY